MNITVYRKNHWWSRPKPVAHGELDEPIEIPHACRVVYAMDDTGLRIAFSAERFTGPGTLTIYSPEGYEDVLANWQSRPT